MGDNDTVDDKTRLFEKLDKIEKRMDGIEEFVGMFKKMMEDEKPASTPTTTTEPKAEPKPREPKKKEGADFWDIFET
jgi:hypothetical protein